MLLYMKVGGIVWVWCIALRDTSNDNLDLTVLETGKVAAHRCSQLIIIIITTKHLQTGKAVPPDDCKTACF